MKVLFVNSFTVSDYLNDMVYHGLIENGFDVYETAYPFYMMSNTDITNIESTAKRFSLYGKMTHQPKVDDFEVIHDKINSLFYDIVIFGSIRRDSSFFDEVVRVYPKDRIHFVDGEDDQTVITDLQHIGISWKRELVGYDANPISFAIPESQLITEVPKKEKVISHIVPGNPETYIFKNEQEYYTDYAKSYYGRTSKKAGWDCMRHYEILANRCVPLFSDLKDCPTRTMINFPKDVIKEANRYSERFVVHPRYDEICDYLFSYTKHNLTTKHLVKRMIEF
jgi:hypothetical protein